LPDGRDAAGRPRYHRTVQPARVGGAPCPL